MLNAKKKILKNQGFRNSVSLKIEEMQAYAKTFLYAKAREI